MSTIIKASSLTKKFGSFTAVDNISIDIKKGEVVGFVGPNGAGKTTTISMMLGFIAATRGKSVIFNTEIKPQNAHTVHKNVGYAAGDMSLFDTLTGYQYLDFFANVNGKAPAQAELIKALAPKLDVKVGKLSRGNKQKVALIGALQHQPELLIFDEPTSGLDPIMQKTFLDLIESEKSRGTTVFMSSHILTEVSDVADRVLFMKNGQIIIDKPIAELQKEQGKRVILSAPKSLLAKIAKNLPKTSDTISLEDGILSFKFHGEYKSLITWLSKQDVADANIQTETLEDIFAEHYKNGDESR